MHFSDLCNVATELRIIANHYENTPMQYTAIFHGCKNDNFQLIFFFFYYFHVFAQNIYCRYTLEPPHLGVFS